MIDALHLPRQFKGMVLQLGPIAAHGLDLRAARAGSIKNAGLVGQHLGAHSDASMKSARAFLEAREVSEDYGRFVRIVE